MAYVPHTPHLGIPPIAATLPASTAAGRSTPGPWLGDIIRAQDPNYGTGEFIYLKGAASTVVGSWVTYNPDDWSTTLLVANAIGPVAVAMSANVANQYGWYQIQGKAVGQVLAGFVDDANVYATATPGSVDDAVVAGDRVKNAKGASAIGTPSAGLAEFEIARPFMDDGLAA
ncbi:hypothetical protein [Mesorhizobium sp.]|uniref:hypothetical protein n=1 Tax=Mesorhizobium sp. TaxID=1871066 RepID=UPI000FE7745D|nr:hypothetical protein [Mesorhizobium sp.]RWG02571.1 MAG: hypothetical protein EOQ54_19655 [Mesorhizobium sp.]RWH00798.1 MAG: hypothetical protein EOQ72_09365 [Mesorhizobium sp.]TIN47589.1 MAG: hypothetical protein E5Y25_05205 [Mesorhizobium sp.]TIR92672.1 MAG: hypothetical protein E5X08_13495 [Mesorhizobium sp.]